MSFSFMRLICRFVNTTIWRISFAGTVFPPYQFHKCLLSALVSVKNRFYCNICFCTGAITCHIIHNLNPFYFSVIALTLYKDTDLLTLPYPQVTVEMTQKTEKQI